MYLRHQSQVIFVAVYPFYVREKLNSLKIFMFADKLVANLRILCRIQRAGRIDYPTANFDIFRGLTQDIILQNR